MYQPRSQGFSLGKSPGNEVDVCVCMYVCMYVVLSLCCCCYVTRFDGYVMCFHNDVFRSSFDVVCSHFTF